MSAIASSVLATPWLFFKNENAAIMRHFFVYKEKYRNLAISVMTKLKNSDILF